MSCKIYKLYRGSNKLEKLCASFLTTERKTRFFCTGKTSKGTQSRWSILGFSILQNPFQICCRRSRSRFNWLRNELQSCVRMGLKARVLLFKKIVQIFVRKLLLAKHAHIKAVLWQVIAKIFIIFYFKKTKQQRELSRILFSNSNTWSNIPFTRNSFPSSSKYMASSSFCTHLELRPSSSSKLLNWSENSIKLKVNKFTWPVSIRTNNLR